MGWQLEREPCPHILRPWRGHRVSRLSGCLVFASTRRAGLQDLSPQGQERDLASPEPSPQSFPAEPRAQQVPVWRPRGPCGRPGLDAPHTCSAGARGPGAEEEHPRVSRARSEGRGLDTRAAAGRPGGGEQAGHQPRGPAPPCHARGSPRWRPSLCSAKFAGLTPSLRPPTPQPPSCPPCLPHARPGPHACPLPALLKQ